MNDDDKNLNNNQDVDSGSEPVVMNDGDINEQQEQVTTQAEPDQSGTAEEVEADSSAEESALVEPEVEPTIAEEADEEGMADSEIESSEPSDGEAVVEPGSEEDQQDETVNEVPADDIIHSDDPNVKWYVVHTYSGHENKVATALKQRVEAEHLEHKIMDVLVPTQEKIEIRGGKKAAVKEKIFPGYILVKMILDDNSWLAVRTTQGVTSFIGIGNKPTPIPEAEVRTIVKFMTQGAAPTFKDVFMVDDTVKIIDGPFSEFIGKVDSVDKEHGKVRVLVSIFGRETPVELDFLQVQKL